MSDANGTSTDRPLHPRRSLPLPLERRSAPREHGAGRDRHADRLLRQGRLHRSDGVRHLELARLHHADPRGARQDARRRLPHHAHARRAPPRPGRSAGQQALALAPDEGERRRRHRRRRALRPHPGPRRARLGHHPRAGAAARRDDHRQARQGHLLRDRLRSHPAATRDRQPDPDRDHHRRLRAHDDARGERSRLRVPDPGGLLRGDRRRQPRGGDQDGEDAERRVRHACRPRARCWRRCHEPGGRRGRPGGRRCGDARRWRRWGSPSSSGRCGRWRTCR